MWIDWLLSGSVALLGLGCVLHMMASMADDLDVLERLAEAPYDDADDQEVRQ